MRRIATHELGAAGRLLRYGAIALGLALNALAGASASPPKLTAGQIVDRNVAARGGLDAWRKIQTMVWIGHLESEHAPLPSMGFVLEQKRPDMTRFQLIAMNERTVRVFDGRQEPVAPSSSASDGSAFTNSP